jgi:thioredoxin reductase (NADPH)
MEEANFLTKFASKVTILVRTDKLRASKIMGDRAAANPKIEFKWNTEVTEVLGVAEGKVTGVMLKDTVTGAASRLDCQGVFAAIGHVPNTKLFEGQLELDKVGYIVMKDRTSATTVPGVFAAGDVMDPRYRQAVTAAGSGCAAALDAQRYLEEMAHA